MTLAKAREDWEKANPEGDFEALSHDDQMAILEAAVIAERKKRK